MAVTWKRVQRLGVGERIQNRGEPFSNVRQKISTDRQHRAENEQVAEPDDAQDRTCDARASHGATPNAAAGRARAARPAR